MSRPLRLLMIEDSEDDALLIVGELHRGGYEPMWERVDTAPALVAALQRQPWDVITCDWVMPQFSAPAALAVLRDARVDVPIILVSGQVGEEFAVAAMRDGAHDFVSKQRLMRLCPAVERELCETEIRQNARQMAIALDTSEKRYHRLFEAAQDGILLVDARTGQITDVNPFLMSMLGYTHEEIVTKRLWELSPFKDLAGNQQAFQELQAKGSVRYDDLPLQTRDGQGREVEFVSNVYSLDGEQVIQCTIRDISVRKRAERALREGDARFAAVLRASPLAILTLDIESRITSWNPAAERLFGWTEEEVLGRSNPIIPEDRRDEFRSLRDRACAGETVTNVEVRRQRKDGSVFSVNLSFAPLRAADGTVTGLMSILADLSERQQAAAALQASEARLRSVIENSPDLISIVDREGTYRYVNPTHEVATGFSPDELLGTKAVAILHPDDGLYLMGLLADGVRTGVKQATVEYRLRHKDGSYHHVEGIAINLVDDPAVAGVLITGRDVTDRKFAERQLADAWHYTQTLLDAAPIGIIAYAASGDVVSANAAAARLIGATLEQLKHQNFRKLRSWQESDLLVTAEAALATGQERRVETHVTTSFDKSLWLSARFVPFHFARETRLLALFVDITERQQAEEALRQRDARSRAILDAVHDGIITIDERAIIRSFNRAAQQLFGYGQEIVGQNVSVLAAEPYRSEHDRYLARYLKTGERKIIGRVREVVGQRKDGTTFPLQLGVSEMMVDGERAFLGIVHDITEPKRMEEALRLGDVRYRALFEHMLEGFAYCRMLFDENGRPQDLIYLEVNSAFERLTGLQDVLGKKITDVIPGIRETHPELLEIHGRVALTGQSERIELYVKPLNRWLSISVFSVEKGTFVAAFDNITARKQAEEAVRRLNEELERRVEERTAELEVVNKELDAFSYSVSHDLRAPLRHVAGFSHALVERYGAKLDPPAKHYLDRIQAGTDRMGQLIEDLLSLSRVARTEMVLGTVNLSDLAEAVATALRQNEPKRQVEFVIAPRVVASGDAHLLRIVLDNLLSNAWKYTSKHPTAQIEFGAIERPGTVAYFVRDDGAGFDMAYTHKLFGAFQRLHTESEFEGTGIGLATVQRIIHRHGGRVWAESAPEQGATFYFTLA